MTKPDVCVGRGKDEIDWQGVEQLTKLKKVVDQASRECEAEELRHPDEQADS